MGINLLQWNIQGSFQKKSPEIAQYLHDENIHVACFNETLLTSTPPIFPGFQNFSTPYIRSNPNAHGNLILVKNSIPTMDLCSPFPDSISILLHLPNNLKCAIHTIYHPPSGKIINQSQFIECLGLPHPSIILGDFNARHINFFGPKSNPNGRKLLSILKSNQFHLLNTPYPTRICPSNPNSSSLLDLAISNTQFLKYFQNYTVLPISLSDHFPILIQTSLNQNLSPPTPPPRFPCFEKADWDSYNEALRLKVNLAPPEPQSPIEIEVYNEFISNSITEAANANIPFRSTSFYNPIVTKEVKALLNEKKRLTKYFISTRCPTTKTKLNALKNKIKTVIRSVTASIIENNCKKFNHPPDAKTFWKSTNNILKKSSTPLPPLKESNRLILSDQDKANAFAKYLNSTFQINTSSPFKKDRIDFINRNAEEILPYDNSTPPPPDNEIINHEFSISDILNAISSTHRSAPGPDKIYYIHLFFAPLSFLNCIAKLFKASLRLGYVPKKWKEASIIVIPKPNKPHNRIPNYRPISLTSNLCKVFEKIITPRLLTYLSRSIPDHQRGFLPNRSSSDCLFRISDHINKIRNLKQRKSTILVALDTEKAFDTVWHSALIYKLYCLNVPPLYLRWIKNFITDRISYVKINDTVSIPFTPAAGVPQGSVISPLLFTLFTQDIPLPPTNVFLATYADDVSIWSSHRSKLTSFQRIQNYLYELSAWANSWLIKINPTKSKAIWIQAKIYKNRVFPPLFE
jgi:hypothetical protein